MRITIAGLITGLLALYATAAAADCTRPRPAFEIPDGNSTTQQELTAAQAPLVAFANQVREYLRCMNGEASQKAIGKNEAQRAELTKAHLAAHQAAANELAGLAACYQAQVETFKKSEGKGGQGKRAADCSSFIKAAATAAATQRDRAGAPVTRELTVESSGFSFDVPGGSWIYYLVRDDSPLSCSPPAGSQCLYRAVHVRNDSDSVLECQAHITYEGTDITGNATTRSKALVAERSTYVVVASLAQRNVNAQTFEAQCTPRAPLPALDTPAKCKYQVVQPVAIGDYYPQASRQAGETGPVIVEFTLSGKAAHPTNVRAVASSLYDNLDQAAVKAVSDMVMSSSCPNTRYRLKLNFQLEQ